MEDADLLVEFHATTQAGKTPEHIQPVYRAGDVPELLISASGIRDSEASHGASSNTERVCRASCRVRDDPPAYGGLPGPEGYESSLFAVQTSLRDPPQIPLSAFGPCSSTTATTLQRNSFNTPSLNTCDHVSSYAPIEGLRDSDATLALRVNRRMQSNAEDPVGDAALCESNVLT